MPSLVITCEHAGNEVPDRYVHLFHDPEALNSHRGWDPGALSIAEFVKSETKAPLFSCKITRLLIELNRSLNSMSLFSEYSSQLTSQEKGALVNEIYLPYRDAVEAMINHLEKPVLHFSIHTFTPVLNGISRTTDVGILYDPSRGYETVIAGQLMTALTSTLQGCAVDFNQPYAGIDDGFTTYLRTRFGDSDYAGIEIEVNQRFAGSVEMKRIENSLAEGIRGLSA